MIGGLAERLGWQLWETEGYELVISQDFLPNLTYAHHLFYFYVFLMFSSNCNSLGLFTKRRSPVVDLGFPRFPTLRGDGVNLFVGLSSKIMG